MSLCVDEGYYHDYDNLVNKGPYRGPKKPMHRYPLTSKRCADDVLVSKTLYDPAGTLSKKQQRRLKALPANEFQFNVPYSLNKYHRWETINPKSLLLNNAGSDREVLVINGVTSSPSTHTPDVIFRAHSVHMLEDDVLATIATSGRAKELAYFTAALRKRKELPKDEPESTRIQFNIVKADCVSSQSTGKSSRRKKRNANIMAKLQNDFGDYEQVSDECGYTVVLSFRSTITLGDFVSDDLSSDCDFVIVPRMSGETLPSQEDSSEKPALPELLDISQATNSHCIFEVFDIKLRQLKPFDLREKVTALVPTLVYGRCVVHWFDSTRVSISNQPLADTVFSVFFELRDNLQTLRIRCNTNTHYSGVAGRPALAQIVSKSRDFDTLFNKLMDFIWESRARQYEPPEGSSRLRSSVENFKPRVNSNTMAVTAKRCVEHDQMMFIKEQYSRGASFPDSETISSVKEENPLCCSCQSSVKTDLFPSLDGMICKDCVAAQVLHQIRLNHFPIQIPVVTFGDNSPLDLLHAILPVPLISTLVRMSFSHFHKQQNPEAALTHCPQCGISLIIDTPNEFKCCVCPDCKCHFCHICLWEPHWPLSCEEMEDWSQKWDEQYLTERFLLDEGERVLRIKCPCTFTFYVPESIAHGTYCPRKRCHYRFDKNGLMRSRTDLWWWYTARQRQIYIERDGKIEKCGMPTEPEYLSPKRVIRKEFAAICAEARNLRFNEKEREMFSDVVLKTTQIKPEQSNLVDTRRTVLLLVEHCTAWLYIHRDDSIVRDIKSLPSKLFHQLMNVERKIEDGKYEILADMEQLEKEVQKLISVFRKVLQQKQAENSITSSESDPETA
ncbi:hypothetical protein ANCCAN_12333 [Ancylostoma caninum]|uniref:IBR domain protein n=1 Tax=Ancylostoma caninum TaxID=29170 RepID=A0A368GDH2_ANCCA|nr:hypothetical protein ANCCAN_12333 [Ancylostoma caninum]